LLGAVGRSERTSLYLIDAVDGLGFARMLDVLTGKFEAKGLAP
jgi:hypothetical protein